MSSFDLLHESTHATPLTSVTAYLDSLKASCRCLPYKVSSSSFIKMVFLSPVQLFFVLIYSFVVVSSTTSTTTFTNPTTTSTSRLSSASVPTAFQSFSMGQIRKDAVLYLLLVKMKKKIACTLISALSVNHIWWWFWTGRLIQIVLKIIMTYWPAGGGRGQNPENTAQGHSGHNSICP